MVGFVTAIERCQCLSVVGGNCNAIESGQVDRLAEDIDDRPDVCDELILNGRIPDS